MTHRTPKVLRVLEALRALPPPAPPPRTRGVWGAAADGGLIAEREHARQSAVPSPPGES